MALKCGVSPRRVGRIFLSVQKLLHTRIIRLLSAVPDSGISTNDVAQFRTFCRYVQTQMQSAPRNIIQKRFEKTMREQLATDDSTTSPMSQLGAILGLTAKDKWLTWRDKFELLPQGKAFEHLKYLEEKAVTDRYGRPGMLDEIREGMRAKRRGEGKRRKKNNNANRKNNDEGGDAAAVNVTQGGDNDDAVDETTVDWDEEERRIEDTIRTLVQKAMEDKERAARDVVVQRGVVETDPTYVKWRTCVKLWADSGMKAMQEEYEAFEKKLGDDRVSNGFAFENLRHQLIGGIAEALMLTQQQNQPQQSHTGYEYKCGGRWVHKRTKKDEGEVDLAICTSEGVVVAVVEVKSNPVEVALGLEQHRAKVENRTHHLVFPDGVHVLAEGVQVFVATLIPDHDVVINLDSDARERVMKPMFQNPERVETEEGARQLLDEVRAQLTCLKSAQQVLRESPDRVIVVL